MVSKKVVRKMQTTAGDVYITGFLNKGEFFPSRTGKKFKTKSGALKSIGQ